MNLKGDYVGEKELKMISSFLVYRGVENKEYIEDNVKNEWLTNLKELS